MSIPRAIGSGLVVCEHNRIVAFLLQIKQVIRQYTERQHGCGAVIQLFAAIEEPLRDDGDTKLVVQLKRPVQNESHERRKFDAP